MRQADHEEAGKECSRKERGGKAAPGVKVWWHDSCSGWCKRVCFVLRKVSLSQLSQWETLRGPLPVIAPRGDAERRGSVVVVA